MNLIKIDNFKYPSPALNKILHYWMAEKKKHFASKDLVYIAEADSNSIGLGSEEFEKQIGNPGRSDWYDVEDTEIENLILEHSPVTKDQTMGVGILEINGPRFAPHIDPSNDRSHCLNYIINPGGNDIRNIWYDIKPEHQWRNMHCCWIPYDRLISIEEYKLKPETWYQLKTDAPHSVEDVSSTRLLISIPLKEPIV